MPAGAVAKLLGLSVQEFETMRPQLEARGFPLPDITTGKWCIESVDHWRRLRNAHLHPELAATPGGAVDARSVAHERIAAMRRKS